MSNIVIGKADGRNIHLDLDILLRTRLLIQANSGQGKSFLIRRLAEQLFGKIQVILIDPEGEFATLREKFGYVLVGKGGETPTDSRSAAMVAHKLLELKASAVCDLYEMKPSLRHEWVRLFGEALIDAPKNLWHPVVIVLDEAHVYVPEKSAGESEASESMIGISTRGRKRGFAMVAATQRLGKLRKDFAAELLNVLIGGTSMDIDRKRAADALGVYGTDQRDFFDEIKLLKPGQFYALGPALCRERTLFKVGDIETTHPEAGSTKLSAEPPPPPEAIAKLLPKLADLPKAAEEKARTESELRAEIRSLKVKLRVQPVKAETKTVVDYSAIDKAIVKRDAIYDRQMNAITRGLMQIVKLAQELAAQRTTLSLPDRTAFGRPFLSTKKETGFADNPGSNIDSTLRKAMVHETQGSKNGYGIEAKGIVAGALRMLSALAQWYPNGMTQGQLRAHAGLRKSGTYSTYLSRLRASNLIEERGGLFYAMDSGIEYCGENRIDAPMTTEEVVSLWKPKLNASGAQRMLDVLVRYAGEPLTKEQLAEESGIVVSGTFSTYLSRLRTAKLAKIERGGMVAADKETLFL